MLESLFITAIIEKSIEPSPFKPENLNPYNPITGQKEERTPCFKCPEDIDREICCQTCPDLKAYQLQFLRPDHKLPKRELPKARYYTRGVNLTTQEEYRECQQALVEIKNITRFSSVKLSEIFGCTPYILNSINRNGQASTRKEIYYMIMEYRRSL